MSEVDDPREPSVPVFEYLDGIEALRALLLEEQQRRTAEANEAMRKKMREVFQILPHELRTEP